MCGKKDKFGKEDYVRLSITSLAKGYNIKQRIQNSKQQQRPDATLDLATYKIRARLKGLSHEIFGPVWMYLGLNVNRLRFLNFNAAPLILDK
jgi:hypothetical protein